MRRAQDPEAFLTAQIAALADGSEHVKVGIHLPQYGRASSADAIRRAAVHAEELGFADVWVSDHVAIPASQDYPSPFLYDPLMTLTWAAAATTRVGLGTSVLVLPQHTPLYLANTLASLDRLSDGRLTIAVGVGWSERGVRRARSELPRPRAAHRRDHRPPARVLA